MSRSSVCWPWPLRGVLLAGAVVLLLLSGTPRADAHAALISSEPDAGARLEGAPGVVRVRFSEPLILELSTMSVVDPTGRVWPRTGASERMMLVSLDTTAQGVYRVEWKTVSPLDGHTLQGEFFFGVGVAPEEAGETVVGPQRSDLLLGAARVVENGALLVVVGALMVGWVAGRRPALSWVRVRGLLVWASVVALAGGVLVVLGEATLASPQASLQSVADYLAAPPGVPRFARLGAETLILVSVLLGQRMAVAVASITALGALAAAGHAAAVTPAWWGISVGTLHLLGAGVWAGGIATLVFLRPPDGWRGQAARDLLGGFSPPAIAGFLAMAFSGGLRGIQELAGLGDLVSTSYGRVLAVKVAAVAVMVPLSWRAWRRRRTAPRVETALGLVAVLAAGALAAYPLPPGRAAEAAALAEGSQEAFPQAGDLTLGANTGDVLVGLTLRPGLPGPNQALIYFLPRGGEEAADRLEVTLTLDEETTTILERCGTACRTGPVTIQGGETIEIGVEGVSEPAIFPLPALPAADGAASVELLDARMGELKSLRYEEVLTPADPPILSTVEMVAPNRTRVVIHTFDREHIRIGDTFYVKDGPDQPWETSSSPVVTVPAFIWDYPDKVGLHIVATEEISGTPTQVVAFFVNVRDNLPIWYRLWVDETGLVHRAEMRAEGHFMDHTYSGFDTPITITDPTG